MNIDRFKHDHEDILAGIDRLRKLSHQGTAERAVDIADTLKRLSALVIRHLAVENRILYPSLEQGEDARMARMGKAYREDMKGIAAAFIGFSRHWSEALAVRKAPDAFRAEANVVLKNLHQRMQRENREFYPAIEAW